MNTLDQMLQLHYKLYEDLRLELKLRDVQYTNYLDQELKALFRAQIETVALKNLVTISVGQGQPCGQEGAYPLLNGRSEVGKTEAFAFDGPAVLVSATGMDMGCGQWYAGEFDATVGTYVITGQSPNIDMKYLFYVLKVHFKAWLEAKDWMEDETDLTVADLQAYEVPLPTLEEQKLLAEKLDVVTAYMERTQLALEGELEQREKQYIHLKTKATL